jgi:PAS domain S-box-containing protein
MKKSSTILTAKTTSENISHFRSFYSKHVVGNISSDKVTVSHNYRDDPSAIPLPATLSIELGEHMRENDANIDYKLFSSHPFPWRQDRTLNEDEKRIISSKPEEEVALLSDDGHIRYFTPVVMSETCISCHNQTEGSPRTDWKVGDIRGYQVVSMLPDHSEYGPAIGNSFHQIIAFFVLSFFVSSLTITYLLRKNKAAFDRVESVAESELRKGEELSKSNVMLQNSLLELEKTREKEKMLSLVASLTDNAVIITNRDGAIRWVNDGFTRLSGYEPCEVVGREPGNLLQGPESDEAPIIEMATAISEKTGFETEILNYAKDGRQYWIQIEAQPIITTSGDFDGYIAIERDVTKERLQSTELIEAREAAEESSSAKSRFLAMMSHEIRTPLNAILGGIELMQDDDDGENRKLFLPVAREAAENLLTIVNDILDITRIEVNSSNFEKEICNIGEVIEDIRLILNQRAKEKNISLIWSEDAGAPKMIETDAPRLKQILINLVSNAIKFTDTGTVSIRASACPSFGPHGEAGMRVSVTDTGLGISEDDMKSIFDEFWTKNLSTSNSIPGTGLGLAIARRLAENLGGTIDCSSVEGVGSTFWIDLPLGNAGELLEDSSSNGDWPQKSDGFNDHLLLIEDNPANQMIARAMLEKLGVSVDIAANAENALDVLQDKSHDMILMDVNIPEMGEIASAIQVRKGNSSDEVSLVAMTARALNWDERKLRSAGFDDCVSKPFSPMDLRQMLNRHHATKRSDPGNFHSGT